MQRTEPNGSQAQQIYLTIPTAHLRLHARELAGSSAGDATIRRQLSTLPNVATVSGLTPELFGAAGKGTRDEYDLQLDWKRFGEWQLR